MTKADIIKKLEDNEIDYSKRMTAKELKEIAIENDIDISENMVVVSRMGYDKEIDENLLDHFLKAGWKRIK